MDTIPTYEVLELSLEEALLLLGVRFVPVQLELDLQDNT